MRQRVALALALLLLAGGSLAPRPPQPSSPPPAGVEYRPSLSDDGRYLAVARPRTSGARFTDIWVADLNGHTSWCATAGADRPSFQPQLSADGSSLVFCSEASNLTRYDENPAMGVFWMDLATRGRRRLAAREPEQSCLAPVLSEDGQLVVACTPEGGLNCWQLERGAIPQLLTRARGEGPVLGRGALRGGRIAFSACQHPPHSPVQAQLWLATMVEPTASGWITADRRLLSERGSAPSLAATACAFEQCPDVLVYDFSTRLCERVPAPGECFEPSLSQDGRWLAFTAYAGSTSDIYLYDRSEGTVSRLTAGTGSSYSPCLAADGNSLVFVTTARNLPGPVVRWKRPGSFERVVLE